MTHHNIGDVRSDGKIFGFYYEGKEKWYNPKNFLRHRLVSTHFQARRRAEKKGLPFDLTLDYLIEIFPANGLCPALGIPLAWGNADGTDSSPSLDRIHPDKGYIRGNVRFLSNKANRIKTNATTDEIVRVAEFLKGSTTDAVHH